MRNLVMVEQKTTRAQKLIAILLLCLLGLNISFIKESNASQLDFEQLNQNNKVQRGSGSRLESPEHRRNKSYEEKDLDKKFEYLKRVLSGERSSTYQTEIESMILSDNKFVKRCWKKANNNGVEVFFTINESGNVTDLAWFPKHRAGKCIKRHISKIEFPEIEKPYHAWLTVSETRR